MSEPNKVVEDQKNAVIQTQGNGSTTSTTTTPKKLKPRFEVKKLNAVGLWAWRNLLGDDNCAICRNGIMDLCNECQAKLDPNNDNCKVTWGLCGHAFHFHCISRWLETRQACPIDNSKWEYQSFGGLEQ